MARNLWAFLFPANPACAPDETQTRALSEQGNEWALAKGDTLHSDGRGTAQTSFKAFTIATKGAKKLKIKVQN